jgi:hypothetical protein
MMRAVKIIHKAQTNKEEQERLMNEVAILRRLVIIIFLFYSKLIRTILISSKSSSFTRMKGSFTLLQSYVLVVSSLIKSKRKLAFQRIRLLRL